MRAMSAVNADRGCSFSKMIVIILCRDHSMSLYVHCNHFLEMRPGPFFARSVDASAGGGEFPTKPARAVLGGFMRARRHCKQNNWYVNC